MSQLLPLNGMEERHRGLTPALASSYLEAARVSLDKHHTSPQEFSLKDNKTENQVRVEWDSPDQRTRGAWANDQDATRDGAYAFALAATELSRGLVAVRRAENLTGADYYVAPRGTSAEDLEDHYRLEVSGTHLDSSEVRNRLREKVRQVRAGKGNLPAIATVVGFKAKAIMVETVENTT